MARRAGFETRFNNDEGVSNTKLRIPSVTNTPAGGDLCTIDATGLPSYQVTTTGTAATQLFSWLCYDGIYDGLDALNKPGYVAATSSTFAISQFGGRSSLDGGGTGKRKFFAPILKNWWFAMDIVDSATTTIVGTSYGVTRSASGVYVVDLANANAAVTVMGMVENDVSLGFGLAPVTGTYPMFGAVTNRHAAVWVRAVGGLFI